VCGVWLSVLPLPAGAQVDIHVGIQLPPPLLFSAPPEVVVLPETYVYVVPDIDEDVFFFDQGLSPERQDHSQQPQAPQAERHRQQPHAPRVSIVGTDGGYENSR
jgi:hypothetical protein